MPVAEIVSLRANPAILAAHLSEIVCSEVPFLLSGHGPNYPGILKYLNF